MPCAATPGFSNWPRLSFRGAESNQIALPMGGGGQIPPVRLPWNDAHFESDPRGRQRWRSRPHATGGWREPSPRFAAPCAGRNPSTPLAFLKPPTTESEAKPAEARAAGACLLSLGWGGGLLAKSACLDTGQAEYRDILRNLSLYGNALTSNLPFPKRRRVVFLNNKPATLPGWALLEVG